MRKGYPPPGQDFRGPIPSREKGPAMSPFSLCVISTILRGLPHWPLLAGLLFPSAASNDGSRILATIEPRRFAVPEPDVTFDLSRPQGQLKGLLFVVVRDK